MGNHHFCGLSNPERKIVRVFAGAGREVRGMNVQLRRTGGCRFRGMKRWSIFAVNESRRENKMQGIIESTERSKLGRDLFIVLTRTLVDLERCLKLLPW